MKIVAAKKRLPVKRIHSKGHWHEKNMAKPINSKKDLATPLDPPTSILSRLRKRRFRRRHNGDANHTFTMSRGIRSALCAAEGDLPSHLVRKQWAVKTAPIRVAALLLEFKKLGPCGCPHWKSIIGKCAGESEYGSKVICFRWCALCGAPTSRVCWCGASLVPTMNQNLYEDFRNFYYGVRNPLSKFTDPADQRAIQTALGELVGFSIVPERQMLVLGGFCLYLALVGKADSLVHVRDALLDTDPSALKISLAHVEKGKLFRGGQRPYSCGKEGLSIALRAFYMHLGLSISPLLQQLRTLRKPGSRAPVVYELVDFVANDTSIACFGPYFQKRFLEILCLMGSIHLGGFHLEDSELDYAAGVFPVAKNSAEGLKAIFPAATNDTLVRQGIRCLCRTMAHKGDKVSFCRMHAMLCFKQKQEGGVLWYS